MPAINALLPIVAASNSQKDGAQGRSEEPRTNGLKNAAKTESKGVDQDAAAEKRLQEKRFISVYEEGLQEQGKQQERAAKQAAERLRLQENEAAVLAASGSPLPPVGEPLPIATAPKTPLELTQSPAQETADTLPAQVPQAPQDVLAVLPEPRSDSATAPVLSAHAQQQAAAAAFHALVTSQNGKAELKPSNSQGIQQAAMAEAVQVLPAEISPKALADDSATQMLSSSEVGLTTVVDELPVQETIDVPAVAKDLRSDAQGVEVGASPRDERPLNLAMQGVQSPDLNTDPSADPVSEENNAALLGREPGQAERVRAWRGVDAQEMRNTPTSSSTQVARQDSLTLPISHSGQIQQFAQSLRSSVAQTDLTAGVVSGERSTTTTPATQTATDSSPWRAESTGTSTQTSGVRTAAANTPFAQTLQASNFGQPLGERVGQNAWGERIAQRVSLMAGQKVSSAQIQLDPPELGAMTIKVSVNGDQASVSFHSPHALVRDALELSFPRLQEMMSQQGMQLVDAQVSDNGFAGQGSGESSGGRSGQPSGEGLDEGANMAPAQIVQVATGLIDFYA